MRSLKKRGQELGVEVLGFRVKKRGLVVNSKVKGSGFLPTMLATMRIAYVGTFDYFHQESFRPGTSFSSNYETKPKFSRRQKKLAVL